MSLALYLKYRPSIFADVIGQEHVTTPLSNALESGKIHHAYLFWIKELNKALLIRLIFIGSKLFLNTYRTSELYFDA